MEKVVRMLMMVVLVLFSSACWAATTTEIEATADTWISGWSGAENTNFSGNNFVWIAPNKSGLIKIDTAGQIPANKYIVSATLDVWVSWTSGANAGVWIYQETDNWVESAATWNTSDGSTPWGGSAGGFGTGMVSGSYVASGLVSPTIGWFQFDVTDAVRAWYDGSVQNRGLLLKWTGNGNFQFSSRETDAKPKLTVTYQPLDAPRYKEVVATADTWMNGGNPGVVQSGYTWIAPAKSGLVKIDITGQIPAGYFIKSAFLDFYINYKVMGDANNTTFAAYMETQDWDEATATWNTTNGVTPWGGSGGGFGTGMTEEDANDFLDVKTVTDANVNNWFQIDVTKAVRAWYDGTAPNYGLLIQRRPFGPGFKFNNIEAGNSPKLNITYQQPDCNSVWEIGQGMAGDLNKDCYVDFKDIRILLDEWLKCTIPGGAGCESVQGGTPTMTIPQGTAIVDGSLSEWTGVEWFWMNTTIAGYPDVGDVSEAKFAVRWNPDTDKVYAAVVVDDSNHFFLDTWDAWDASDRIEVYSQGDNAGGAYTWDFNEAQQYIVGPKTPSTGGYWAAWGSGDPVGGSAQFEYAVAVSGSSIIYEVGVKQFDYYAGKVGIGTTVDSALVIDKVIRFDLNVDTRRTASVFGMLNAFSNSGARWNNASAITQFTLKGTVPNGSCGNWGYLGHDANNDCRINLADFSAYAQDWMRCNDPQGAGCN